MVKFFKMEQVNNFADKDRIIHQVEKKGFTGDIKVYHLGYDSEDSISLVIEGIFEGEKCCCAVGYGMNRQNLAIRKRWYRHAPFK